MSARLADLAGQGAALRLADLFPEAQPALAGTPVRGVTADSRAVAPVLRIGT